MSKVKKISPYYKGVPSVIQDGIVAAYSTGLSTYEVGEQFGVSNTCVGRVLKKNNIKRRKKALCRDQEILSLYQSGKTAPQIEEMLRLSASHVYDVLRKNNIKTRPNVQQLQRTMSKEQVKQLMALYKEGHSVKDISEKINFSSWNVYRFLKRKNLSFRKPSERIGVLSSNWQGGLRDDKEYQRKKAIQRKKDSPLLKLSCTLRSRIIKALKHSGYKKKTKTYFLLGASFEIVIAHLESQFSGGMTWGNHGFGKGKWNADHIIPLASAKTEEELLKLFHFSNLQPLWHEENIKKNSIYNGMRHYYKKRSA